jgi:pimeloyl-ACP methyl ester carboxylesterase
MVYREMKINGQKIVYYESSGPSTSLRTPAVVFIHGNSLSGLSFQKQFESPLAERYRLIAIDLPGHGLSGRAAEPEKTYTLPGYANILVSFAKELGLNAAIFVGFSLGGNVLLEAADKLDASGLLIFGTAPVSSLADFQRACFPNPALSIIFNRELTDDEISAWISALFRPGASDIPEFMIADMKRSDGTAREALLASVVNGKLKNGVEVVANLKIPIAILHGEKEQITNPAYLRGLNIPTLWRGDIQVIPDAGHMPQWEQPERFNRLLEEFIKETIK